MTTTSSRTSARAMAWAAVSLLALAWPASATAAARLTLDFNPDWRFTKSDPEGASAPAFDDRAWTRVSAPHTYNDVDTFDDFSTPGHEGEMKQWAGRTWYRKSFRLPGAFRGRKVFLEIEAARQVAEVYLNGTLLGVSKTGFIPFGFDLTSHLRFDGPNVLAVMCDNRFPAATDAPTVLASELPWNSPHWHPAHGGLYRNVKLHVTDRLHISLPLYSFLQTAGPYAYATDVSERAATVTVEVPVQNERATAEDVELQTTVLDADGRTALTLTAAGRVEAGASLTLTAAGALAAPRLWEPDYPHVYRVVNTLRTRGAVVDAAEVPLGVRTVHWDAATGFSINGRRLKLRGWGQKPTDEWPGLGAAQPDWMHDFTVALMRDAGANFVRWGHCAAGPASIAAADRRGLVTLQPGVDSEGDAVGETWKVRSAAFRDTIIYYRNHPSILIWEGGNQKTSMEHTRELRGFMDRYDPHGGRAYTHRRADPATAKALMDLVLGTEGGREVADLPVVEGEYDREESPRRVWDELSPPRFGYPEAKGQQYQLTSEEYAVHQVAQFVRKLGAWDHAGGANWIFSDTTSGGRLSCEVTRAGGEVDAARLPKEAYYACRAMWRADPQVHIIGHWTYPAGTRKTMHVVSNAEAVELLVNGRSLGRGRVSDRFHFQFPDVAWEPGEVKAVAYAGEKAIATQSKHTVGPPAALRLLPIVGPGGLRADGADIALFDVEAVDARGERCPTFEGRVDFEASGPGVWRGGYNSGKARSTNNTYLDLEAGINRVAVRATRTAGTITVRAHAAGLTPGSASVRSVPVAVRNGFATLPPAPAAVDLPAERAPLAAVDGILVQPGARRVQADTGRYATAFSYSGPGSGVRVDRDARNGERIYTDLDAAFAGLPPELAGADNVQTAQGDRLYKAVDLIEIAVKAGTTVWVAHDDALPRPTWLGGAFEPTDLSLTVNGRPMKLFRHLASKEESLTLGSNYEGEDAPAGNMYVVFVSPPR
jgi:beta-galactosidase